MNDERQQQSPESHADRSCGTLSWPLLIWLLFYPAAGAYGGWRNGDFLGWDNALLAVGVGIVGTSLFTAIGWLRFPVRTALFVGRQIKKKHK
jgi:hypothetical protein